MSCITGFSPAIDKSTRKKMGFGNSKWFVLLFKVGIMGMITVARVTSGDEIGTQSDGLLCISECATCPVICSPPPPSLLNSYPPPPAPSSVHPSPQPLPGYQSPPPTESVSPPSPPRPPPPSPSYSSKGSPPPPFKYFYNGPPGQGPPTVVGPHEYPYPYYYFYASKASSLSFQASLSLVIMLLCINAAVLSHR